MEWETLSPLHPSTTPLREGQARWFDTKASHSKKKTGTTHTQEHNERKKDKRKAKQSASRQKRQDRGDNGSGAGGQCNDAALERDAETPLPAFDELVRQDGSGA
eukprot:GGOE01054783.1.p3 GENE.GGOE01054783.1~~GGOE01054783.1.p3  ORF type:complete len:104 (+),score=0.02 GGOE01054783.1:104-415(+)